MLWAIACMVAVTTVFLLRPARTRAVPARVVPGDSVATEDGLDGTVVRLDGGFALVDAGSGRNVWVRAADLMLGSGACGLPGEPLPVDRQAGLNLPTVPPLRSPASAAEAGGLLVRFAAGVFAARRIVVGGWIVTVLACMPLAGTAEKAFSPGGFLIKDGEAITTLHEVQDDFHMPVGRQTMVVTGTVKQAQRRLDRVLPELYRVPFVSGVSKPRASKDGTLVAVTILFNATDDDSVNSYDPIVETFIAAGWKRDEIQAAGSAATFADTSSQMKRDLAKAETIGTPLALVVLLLVFGTLVSAALPLVVGLASVIITLAILHVLSLPLELSIFVMNIASMLGFGLGIDYSLLGVSRFREELAGGADVRTATMTTIVTSGRAAVVSGVAVLAGVSALAAIPLPVMFSIAIGGVVVVAVTVLASLTLLPAMLGMLGHRVEKGRVRRRKPATETEHTIWYRAAHAVMRRPGLSIAGGIAVLVLIASPVLGAHLDVPHSDVLPTDSPSLRTERVLAKHFGEHVEGPYVIVLDTIGKAKVKAFAAQLDAVPHIARVEVLRRDPALGRTLLNAFGDDGAANGGATARATAERIHELQGPADFRVSGVAAGETEFLEVIRTGMPRVLLLMFVSTVIILSIAFRSLTLPFKAILLDTLSILASLGAVIAVFQDGRGIELLGAERIGYTEATIPIILFCILFGLSMDYEVFMLAKVTELYQAGHDDREATARGVAMTAPLVTGAALILIVIGVAFSLTELVLVKQIGFGMAVALALDATVVRLLLLPATMRWLGPANWWLPAALQRRVPRVEWAH